MATSRQFDKALDASAGFRSAFATVPIGSVAYGSMGTNTTMVAGTILWAEVYFPQDVTITGIKVLNGATVGTDKGIVALYGNNGDLRANSALAGATTAGANALQSYAFTTPYAAVRGRHWLAYQSNGTTDTIRTVAASTFIDVLTTSATGAFGTLTQLTVPTTFTADKGPIAAAYV